MKACGRQKGEMSLLRWTILQYLHPKVEKSGIKLPHKNAKVCLFHKAGTSNRESFAATLVLPEGLGTLE